MHTETEHNEGKSDLHTREGKKILTVMNITDFQPSLPFTLDKMKIISI